MRNSHFVDFFVTAVGVVTPLLSNLPYIILVSSYPHSSVPAAASAQYNSFTPVLQGYSSTGCNATQLFSTALNGCTLIAPGQWAVGDCSFEDDKHASIRICSDTACSLCGPLLPGLVSASCYTNMGAQGLPLGGAQSLNVYCSSSPTPAAASVVVGLAVSLTLAAVGMCAFWVMKVRGAQCAGRHGSRGCGGVP